MLVSAGSASTSRESANPVILAYEPSWAIGQAQPAPVEHIREVTAGLRQWLTTRNKGRVIYGGSVTPANTASLMEQPDIDGALVGGASIKAADFVQIVQATAEVVRAKPV